MTNINISIALIIVGILAISIAGVGSLFSWQDVWFYVISVGSVLIALGAILLTSGLRKRHHHQTRR